jgi:hypothetical protein
MIEFSGKSTEGSNKLKEAGLRRRPKVDPISSLYLAYASYKRSFSSIMSGKRRIKMGE